MAWHQLNALRHLIDEIDSFRANGASRKEHLLLAGGCAALIGANKQLDRPHYRAGDNQMIQAASD